MAIATSFQPAQENTHSLFQEPTLVSFDPKRSKTDRKETRESRTARKVSLANHGLPAAGRLCTAGRL